LVKASIDITSYQDYLLEDPETAKDRAENLSSLVGKACEWEEIDGDHDHILSSFLEELSLKSSLDEADITQERVNLMTIHNGKGLEFDVAFLAGMEEDLFPHANARESEAGIEEERRLCYVGMTRAKEYLYLTDVSLRSMWGVTRNQRPSRFIREIPSEFIEKVSRTQIPGSSYPFSSQRAARPVRSADASTDSDFIEEQNTEHINDIPVSKIVDIPSFTSGDVIFHKEFGIGHIKQAYQGSAGLTYQILFTKENVEKSIDAKYAHLTKL